METTYRIVYSGKGPMDPSPAYWSNSDGWTTADGADHFTEDEANEYLLPIDGAWVPVPTSSAVLNEYEREVAISVEEIWQRYDLNQDPLEDVRKELPLQLKEVVERFNAYGVALFRCIMMDSSYFGQASWLPVGGDATVEELTESRIVYLTGLPSSAATPVAFLSKDDIDAYLQHVASESSSD
jgi:hypothetical protein